ncbi:MAG: TMEM14 family protein [Acidobacteria bacterium]|nr:TMEM14 family protein [Acidobacteriota bacterium]
MHSLASWIILSYAVLLIASGLAGWRLGGSRISFTAGLASAALLTAAHRVSQTYPSRGYLMATAISLLLAVMFFLRFRKTGKLFPAGLLLALSGIVAVTLGWMTVASW